MMPLWKPEDNLGELVLLFHDVGPKERTQVIRLGGSKIKCVLNKILPCSIHGLTCNQVHSSKDEHEKL